MFQLLRKYVRSLLPRLFKLSDYSNAEYLADTQLVGRLLLAEHATVVDVDHLSDSAIW